MKILLISFFTSYLLLMADFVDAQSDNSDSEIFAKRGKGVVTQEDFTARADKIPESARFTALRDPGRLQSVLNALLLQEQLAADAREAGFDQQKVIQGRMNLAANAELAAAWLQHYVETQPAADYEQLAMEYYQLNSKDILSQEDIDVSHILVSSETRTNDEAKELADTISQQLTESPDAFDELVITYSDDESKSTNKGRFFGVKRGDMVKSFEDAAFALEAGQISSPVKTQYGFHIIRLDAYHKPEQMSFEDVKGRLIQAEEQRHAERIKQHYMSSLTSLDVEMTKEALEEMVRRQLEGGSKESSSTSTEKE